MSMIRLKAGETVTLPIKQEAPFSGRHGALTFSALLLLGASTITKTPGDPIMREEATPVSPPVTGTAGAPSFSAGGGAGGADVYTVALGTGEGASFTAGDFVRSQAANRKGVYEIDSIATDTLKLKAATGEMDVQSGDTIEKVTGSKWYSGQITVTATEATQVGHVEFQVLGKTAAERGNKPALSEAISTRKIEYVGPQSDASSVETV